MKKKTSILVLILFISMCFNSTVQAFAKGNTKNEDKVLSTSTTVINDKTTVKIEKGLETNKIYVYENNKLTQTSVVNNSTGEINLTFSNGDVIKDKVSNHIRKVEGSSNEVQDISEFYNKGINSPLKVSDYAGYTYIKSKFSRNYQLTGKLYGDFVSSWIEGQKRVVFSKGTAVGIIISVLLVFVSPEITIAAILKAIGVGGVSGLITNYVDSELYFEYRKYRYKVTVNNEDIFNTWRANKSLIIHDYVNDTNSYKVAPHDGKCGFAGTEDDMIEGGCQIYREKYGW